MTTKSPGIEPPRIDARNATDIAAQTRALLAAYVPPSADGHVVDATAPGAAAALVGVFAHFAELIIERINRAPPKKQLAFFDLLGAAPLPPQPARAALTFALAAGSAQAVLVPTGTRVTAPPPPGRSDPVIFETECDLSVTAATLDAAFTRDPAADRFADHRESLLGPQPRAVSIFEGDAATEHALYVGHAALFAQQPALDEWRVRVKLAREVASPDARDLAWDVWDGDQGVPLFVAEDGSAQLTKSGTLVFRRPPEAPLLPLDGRTSRWLRCRLLARITTDATAQDGVVRATRLPVIASITLQGHIDRRGIDPLALLANTRPLDADEPMLPFGERPGFGDALHVGIDQAFALQGAKLTLHVSLANAPGATPAGVNVAAASADLALVWEFWDGRTWTVIKPSTDTCDRLTKSGDIAFTLPVALAARALAGVTACWLRVRIAAGNYGKDGSFKLVTQEDKQQRFDEVKPTFAPPIISRIALDIAATLPEAAPDTVLARNDFASTSPSSGEPFAPFAPMTEREPALYLGFAPPTAQPTLPAAPISFYADAPDLLFGRPPDNASAKAPAQLSWEYWDGQGWQRLALSDDSVGMTRAGVIEWLPPIDIALRADFDTAPRCWIRLRWASGDFRHLPIVEQLRLNTTMATQAATVIDEVLGSSDGSKHQRFQTSQRPVLGGERLDVRERGAPAALGGPTELKALGGPAEPGSDDGFVAWTAVDDFHGSLARDRHFVLDRERGELRFGDGVRGLIPPIGSGNVRMTRYRAGGGSAGNVPAGAVSGLQSPIASIDRVFNGDAASGGTDAEAFDDFIARAPRTIRHQGLAVTLDDFEDLACLASPEVMRARAIALIDLERDPDGRQPRDGLVSVIIVPRSQALRPTPSLELLERVRALLDARRSPLAELALVGPEYVRVDVAVELAAVTLDAAAALEARVLGELARFLHPLSGGLDGRGWSFGRKPHRSDLFALLERIDGVDHVRALEVVEKEDRLGVADTGRFLVHSGVHRVRLVAAA